MPGPQFLNNFMFVFFFNIIYNMSYMSGCIYDGYGYDGGMYVNNIKSVFVGMSFAPVSEHCRTFPGV
jgi:hypothetical protein